MVKNCGMALVNENIKKLVDKGKVRLLHYKIFDLLHPGLLAASLSALEWNWTICFVVA